MVDPPLQGRFARRGAPLLALLSWMPCPALAGEGGAAIDWSAMTFLLLGGLALFLYGMTLMADALQSVAGPKMKEILARLTTNPVMGVFTGALVTAIIQSSSVTTVLLVGFVSAGLMTLTQAVGVVFGANIGTTITAQIIAFKITHYAPLLIALGFALVFVSKREGPRNYGLLTMGLGLVFFGMAEMSDAMAPLRHHPPFLEMMATISHPVYGLLLAATFTALIQSSSAATGVILALAMQGLITLEGGIALLLGSNIGTCVTALLATLGRPREALRVAVAHVTFNTVGALLFIGIVPAFAEVVRALSPVADGLAGVERLAAETPRQLANAHTLFNVAMTLFCLPMAPWLVRFCLWLVPEAVSPAGATPYQPHYLDRAMLSTPAIALGMVRREASRMSELIERMVEEAGGAVLDGNREGMARLARMDDAVDRIHRGISEYLSLLGAQNLPLGMSDQVLAAVTAVSEMEAIGDIVETNLAHLAEVVAQGNLHLGEEARAELLDFHRIVFHAYQAAATAFIADSREAAGMVMGMKESIGLMDAKARLKFSQVMASGDIASLEAYRLETDFRENLKRIYYHAKRIAKLVAHVDDAAAWAVRESAK